MTMTPSPTPEFQSFFELLPFTGDVRQNVVHWLMTFNEVCTTADFHDDQRRLWLPLKLLGGPKSWYRLEQQTLVNYNWKQVQMAFIEAFGTSSQIEQASRSLRTHITSHETENSVTEFRSDKLASSVNNIVQVHNQQQQLSEATLATDDTLKFESIESIDPPTLHEVQVQITTDNMFHHAITAFPIEQNRRSSVCKVLSSGRQVIRDGNSNTSDRILKNGRRSVELTSNTSSLQP
ncbi:unnamed protein product, partial [Didymodactylos carnosus]